MSDDHRDIVIDYTNYRGERAKRKVRPFNDGQAGPFYFGSSQYHPDKQWMMVAVDLEKDQVRHFAMKDIHSWHPA